LIDERDLLMPSLSLFCIAEASEDVGDGGGDGWTGEDTRLRRNVGNFEFTTHPSSTTGHFT
jgi:hypothetical protein